MPSEDGNKANLFATVGPNVKDGVVLSGHTDVVPVDGQPWVTDPWTLTLKDGKYYGRGTCDMKAFYAIALAMLPQFLKAPLKKPIHFALSYDEEVGCVGAHALAARMAREVPQAARHHHRRADHDDGGPCPQGRADVRHQVHRLRGAFLDDASRRQRHPLRRRVRPLPQPGAGRARSGAAKNSEFMPPAATFNVGTIVGGTAGNILARECEVLWGYRELPGQPIEGLGERAQKWLKEELLPKMKAKHPAATIDTVLRSSTAGFSPEGNEDAKALAANWSGSNTVGSVVYGTEAGIFRKTLGVPTVVCGPGDIAQAHQPNEFILASQITACEDFMRRMVEWACRN